jgi:predicted RecA/RadA family phage recombinase
MSEAVFVQKGAAIDYTPTEAAVDAGDIVFLANNYAGVAEFPIAQNAMGSLAVTGIFKCAKDGNAIAAGALLYWNTDKAQAGAVSNKYLGRAAIAAAETDPYVYFFLNAPNIGAFTAIDPQSSPVATQATIGDLTATDPTCDAADPTITAVDPAAITAADPTVVDPTTTGIDGETWEAADSVVKAAIEANNTAIKAVESEVKKLIDDVTSIHTQLKAAIADLATLRDSDKAIIDDVQAIETSLEAGIDDIGTLKTAANAAKTDLAAVVTALKTAGALT